MRTYWAVFLGLRDWAVWNSKFHYFFRRVTSTQSRVRESRKGRGWFILFSNL